MTGLTNSEASRARYWKNPDKERQRSRELGRKRSQLNRVNPPAYPKSKICSKCKQEKPASEFHKTVNKADGLHYHCKECKRTKYRTPTEWARVRWNAINGRTVNGSSPDWNHKSSSRHLLKGVRLEMTRQQFFDWVSENWKLIERMLANNEKPSVHRKENDKHYSIGNIEIVSSGQHAKIHNSLSTQPSRPLS